MIRYQDDQILGEINENTNRGIFGTVNNRLRSGMSEDTVEVAFKQEIEQGPATIYCAVDGQVKEYGIQIEKIYLNSKEANKGMVIRVTDEELLAKTGGIVQGMSGSPFCRTGNWWAR